MISLSQLFQNLSWQQVIMAPILIAEGVIGYQLLKHINKENKDSNFSAIIKQIHRSSEEQQTDKFIKTSEDQEAKAIPFEPIIKERQESKEEEAQIFKICVTGGPCAGKTTGMVYVQEKMKELGIQVLVVPEAATIISKGGGMLDMSRYSQDQSIQFQTNLLKLQIRLENSMTTIAKQSKKKTIILCDRGLMDGSAYVDQEEWGALLKSNDLNEVLMRDDRYDLVIHLVSAAIGAEQYYNQNNTARFESKEEATIMDKKTQLAWLGHPNHNIIGNNTKDFEEKLQKMLDSVKQCVGIETTPNKFTKKFLLKSKNSDPKNISSCLKVQSFEIEDVFLEKDSNQQIMKLRKRGQNQNYVYILSSSKAERAPISNKSGILYKKLLSYREYYLILSKADPKRNKLITNRDVFLYQGTVYILDTYLNQDSTFSILKVILKDKNSQFSIPEQFEVAKEVTSELGYKRSSISKKDWQFEDNDVISS